LLKSEINLLYIQGWFRSRSVSSFYKMVDSRKDCLFMMGWWNC